MLVVVISVAEYDQVAPALKTDINASRDGFEDSRSAEIAYLFHLRFKLIPTLKLKIFCTSTELPLSIVQESLFDQDLLLSNGTSRP